MTQRQWPNDERLADLLAQHATEGLDAEARQEMDEALRRDASIDPDAAELAAAAADLAFIEEQGAQAMPADLARKLVDLGERELADRSAPAPMSMPAGLPWSQRTGGIGWFVAAAAVLLAAMLFVTQKPPLPENARTAMLAEVPDAIQVEWTIKTDDYKTVTGDVVWSDSRQEGYMRLVGMPVNDPDKQQYQLWIVDPDRDERPVDGGVFDVSDAGEVIIPIDAKLAVDNPKAFAITVEKPGGVVKSAGPLQVVAPVAG
jgi:anti-sigma-K factor RskA